MNEKEPKIGESWFYDKNDLFLFIRKDKNTITQLYFKTFIISDYHFKEAVFTYRDRIITDAL